MRGRALIVSLLATLAACTEPAPDPLGEPFDPSKSAKSDGFDEPELAECASPLMRAVFERSVGYLETGTVPGSLFATSANRADPTVLIEGPEIFPAMADLIETAQVEVAYQTYTWETDTDPTDTVLDGIARLDARLARDGREHQPVIVRILFDATTLAVAGPPPLAIAGPKLAARIDELELDPDRVVVEFAAHEHVGFDATHSKALIVDGRHAIVMGANPQEQHNFASPWHDAGYRLDGDIALALLADFHDNWSTASVWTCGDRLGLRCTRRGGDIEHRVLPHEVDACLPMLVTTRTASANPLENRIDNPQDQAFVAAFEGAQTTIRIQTPNLNDDAAKAAIVAAIERGVRVELLLSKGFNALEQTLGLLGGPNRLTVEELYEALADVGIEQPCELLDVRWYSPDGGGAIDGNRPRASHAKYMSVDSQLVIVGSANMDTLSWNNLRETNVVIDDPQTTRAWDAQFFERWFALGEIAAQCEG